MDTRFPKIILDMLFVYNINLFFNCYIKKFREFAIAHLQRHWRLASLKNKRFFCFHKTTHLSDAFDIKNICLLFEVARVSCKKAHYRIVECSKFDLTLASPTLERDASRQNLIAASYALETDHYFPGGGLGGGGGGGG